MFNSISCSGILVLAISLSFSNQTAGFFLSSHSLRLQRVQRLKLSHSAESSKIISGLSEIVDSYDGFLVDQWGVLFDANAPYKGARTALEKLKEAGKRVVLLSNSSKRRVDALKNLVDKMKFGPPGVEGLYLDIITSGEVAFDLVTREATGIPCIKPGTKVFVCGSGDGDEEYVQNLGCEVGDPADCDWVLARGNFVLVSTSTPGAQENALAHKKEQVVVVPVPPGRIDDGFAEQEAFFRSDASGLGVACRRGVPLLVANPDMIRPGTNSPMPGTVGRLWASGHLGRKGEVVYVGKPHPSVYEAALRILNEPEKKSEPAAGSTQQDGTPALRLCAVGDAMQTDILGAALHLTSLPQQKNGSGLEKQITEPAKSVGKLLIAHGVHASRLGVEEGKGQMVTEARVLSFVREMCCSSDDDETPGDPTLLPPPTHVAPAFVW